MIINLTSRKVKIILKYGVSIVFEKCANPPRLKERISIIPSLDGIPCVKKSFVANKCLPTQAYDVYYIVSLPIAQAFPDRQDLLVPHDLVRNEKGVVIGYRSLARITG